MGTLSMKWGILFVELDENRSEKCKKERDTSSEWSQVTFRENAWNNQKKKQD